MRIHTALASLGVGLLATTLVACSSGAKSAADKTTSAARTGASSTSLSSAASPTSDATASPATSGATSSASVARSAVKDIDACTLLSAAKASTLVGAHLTSATSSTIASGQDQCDYAGATSLTVIVYQPTSGVSWTMINSVLNGVGDTKSVAGVGDQATVGAIELDARAGSHIVAVQGAGGLLSGNYKGAIAVAKAVIAGLR